MDRYTAVPGSHAATQIDDRTVLAKIASAMDLNNVPWTLVLNAGLGVWLMASPAAFGTIGAAGDADHVAGALVVTWAVIAFGEIVRPVRLLNIVMGLAIALAPWLLAGATNPSLWNDLLVGISLIGLSIRRGRIEERFGPWNRLLI